MRGKGEHKQMWRLFRAALFTVFIAGNLLAVTSCDMIVPPEEESEFDNPRDPENPDTYVAPQTTITSGPLEGSIVNTSTVTFKYESNADLFQTRINGNNWSVWSSISSTTLEYLEEDQHTFEVRSAYDPGTGAPVDIEEIPVAVSFRVDAVTGPSLRLSPLFNDIAQGVDFEIELIAEEVTDLMAVKAVIKYNPSQISVKEIREGIFLTSTGGNLASYFTTDPILGTIEINIGTATGTPPGVTGTGTIVIIKLSGLTTANTDLTFDQAGTELRDSDNNTIIVVNFVGSVVRIR